MDCMNIRMVFAPRDQPLRLAVEGETAVEELRHLLAPVAAPIAFRTERAVAVERRIDVEGVESGPVGLLAFEAGRHVLDRADIARTRRFGAPNDPGQ
jgi:hypothetical protein